jgi:ankyrin repeat protein
MCTNVFSCGRTFCSSLYRAPARLVALAGLFAFAFAVPASCGPIQDAARKGDLAQVQALLKGDPTLISSKDELGETPLAMAAVAGQKDVVEFLLAHGADVNARNLVGNTPLHEAVWEDDEAHKDVVGLLLAHGADVNAKGQQGATPLFDAAFDGSTGVATLLLAKGADVKARDDLGETPLHLAAMSSLAVVNLLLANGADVNAQNIAGSTPLMFAALLAQESVADVLLAHGADVNAKDKSGDTALAYVNSPQAKGDAKSRQAVVDLLRQHGGQ